MILEMGDSQRKRKTYILFENGVIHTSNETFWRSQSYFDDRWVLVLKSKEKDLYLHYLEFYDKFGNKGFGWLHGRNFEVKEDGTFVRHLYPTRESVNDNLNGLYMDSFRKIQF